MESLTAEERTALGRLRGTASLSEIARHTGIPTSRVAIFFGPRPRAWRRSEEREEAHD